jgi:hypothetical protein
MRFVVLSLFALSSSSQLVAQEHWQQLSGAAQAYSVDVHSLAREGEVLSARIRTHDVGSRVIVQQVQVRCAASQLRTVGEKSYDSDTGRPLPQAVEPGKKDSTSWPEYKAGSEGHALLSSLCALARDRNVLGPAEHSHRAA